MGRMHAEAALRFGPQHILVVDVAEDRLEWIRRVLAPRAEQTATNVHAVLSGPHVELLNRVSNGKGADDIIVAVGSRALQNQAQSWLARGGILNLFGGLKRGEHVLELDSLRVHYDEVQVVGSSGGSPADVAEALRMTAAGQFDPGQHLTMVGSLDQFPQALQLVKNQQTDGKIVLYPHMGSTPLRDVHDWTAAEERQFLADRQ
jgi:L-iditol 2-dehydrogenase